MAQVLKLRIKNFADKDDHWRMVYKGSIKNPHAKKADTIKWKAPEYLAASIIVLAESPFYLNNVQIVDKIINIEAGEWSEEYKIDADGDYEYGAVVKTSDTDYTYVAGENSPPGIYVGDKG